ncbi:RsmD family RNA methyltransferase [Pseudenhygromyxa sp. WMMC2535]|nr:DNA methyltransferase [Pseudenhygromyxa sp. WMMC2535]NVB38729.1 RsmD family RNA methyltransferase [Pseudenhygromyxa sp. WMMC2535]
MIVRVPDELTRTQGSVELRLGDNLELLPTLADASFRLIYIDPPFNTGRKQERKLLKTRSVAAGGDRRGFGGKQYATTELGRKSYADTYDDYLGFLEPRLREARRLLSPDGSLFVHLDYREVHYVKVALDRIFGRECFINEIIWAYDYGGRTKKRWPAKHDTILWYAQDPDNYVFDFAAMDRVPYMAPGLVGPEKAARGKTPTDVWWHTIVSPNGKEKTGYPTQKPLGVLRRIIRIHSEAGDRVLDFFAGSGTTGEAAVREGRDALLIDRNPEAVEVMRARLAQWLIASEQGDEAPQEAADADADADTNATLDQPADAQAASGAETPAAPENAETSASPDPSPSPAAQTSDARAPRSSEHDERAQTGAHTQPHAEPPALAPRPASGCAELSDPSAQPPAAEPAAPAPDCADPSEPSAPTRAPAPTSAPAEGPTSASETSEP